MGYALPIQGIYKVYVSILSGIYSDITFHYFHWELCCVEKFCLLHSIALNHGMGLLHWNSKKYIKIEFDILGIYIVYTMYIQWPYIYMECTWYIPNRYLILVPDGSKNLLHQIFSAFFVWIQCHSEFLEHTLILFLSDATHGLCTIQTIDCVRVSHLSTGVSI